MSRLFSTLLVGAAIALTSTAVTTGSADAGWYGRDYYDGYGGYDGGYYGSRPRYYSGYDRPYYRPHYRDYRPYYESYYRPRHYGYDRPYYDRPYYRHYAPRYYVPASSGYNDDCW